MECCGSDECMIHRTNYFNITYGCIFGKLTLKLVYEATII